MRWCSVSPREAGRRAPAGPGRECPPELLGPSPTLHCIYTSQHERLNAGMSTLRTGLSSSSLSKQGCLKRRLDVCESHPPELLIVLQSCLQLRMRVGRRPTLEMRNDLSSSLTKLFNLDHKKIIQSFRKGSIAPGQMLGVSL